MSRRSAVEDLDVDETVPPSATDLFAPKRRGRPKGSKNKPKGATAVSAAVRTIPLFDPLSDDFPGEAYLPQGPSDVHASGDPSRWVSTAPPEVFRPYPFALVRHLCAEVAQLPRLTSSVREALEAVLGELGENEPYGGDGA